MLEFWCPRFWSSSDSHFCGVFIHSPVNPTHSDVDLCTRFQENINSGTMPQLWTGLGAVVCCMSRYIQYRRPIYERDTNCSNGYKLDNCFFEERNSILCRKGVASPVYYFFHWDFPDVDFFASRRYVHGTEEVPEESLFDTTEVPAYKRAYMQPIHAK